MYRIIIDSRRVEKEIDNLSDTDFEKIDAAIRALKDAPVLTDAKNLQGIYTASV